MTILKSVIWILILKNHLSKGFPSDALPGNAYYGKHHAEITDFAIRIAVGRFITDNNLTVVDGDTDVISIVSNFFGVDSDGYEKFVEKQNEIVENVQNQERSKEAHIHCNSEQIDLAHNHVIKRRGQIEKIAQSAEPNLPLIRQMIGKCIYTIQAFYSGTNWVEMNGDAVYTDFGVSHRKLMDIASVTMDTCRDCDNSGKNRNSCKTNLLVSDILTSGYQTGQDVQTPYKTSGDIDKGKCGFGGKGDTENGYRTAKGGINKDRLNPMYSPHHHLHYNAIYAARNATVQFLIDKDIGIINELKPDTFIQVFGLVRRHKASFGFVIDDTSSMGSIISQVQKACIDIMTNVLGTANAPSNYILVTFNDPEKHVHRLTTENGLEMINALGNVVVEGGSDCPEYAMSGLQKAIDLCIEKSTIFFYTDAPAKDKEEYQTVIEAVNEKSIDLRLFLKDSLCKDRTKRDTGSEVYSLVAEGTGGTVYRFNTAELGDIIRQISEELFPSATVTVDKFELEEDADNSMMFPVDSMLTNVKITVIGVDSADDVDIASRFGSVLTSENTSVLFESPDKVVVTVLNPKPAIYNLIRSQNNRWTVSITAQTSVDFQYVITEKADDGQLYRASGNPVVGDRYTLFVTVYNLPIGMQASSLRLKTSNSTTNYLNLTQIAGGFDSTYVVATTLTADRYDVSIYGTDSSGSTWMRTSPNFIFPVTIKLELTSMPDLYINANGNVSYTLENKGSENDTFVIDVTDNRDLLTGNTSFTRLISSNGFTEITFQIQGSSVNNTVTYTITVRRNGSDSIMLQESQTIYISPDIAPSCTVNQLVGICDDLDITSCSEVTWNGQATVTFATELTSISGSKGWIFETSSIQFSPININVSGDCCLPSAYLTVIDKKSNFARCHFYIDENSTNRCGENMDRFNTKWNSTPENTQVNLSCTGEHVGSVARSCSSGRIWEEPDYSQCISKSMLYIQQQVTKLLSGDIEDDLLSTFLEDLENLTRDNYELRSGDLLTASAVLYDIAKYLTDHKDKLSFDQLDVFGSICNNLLDERNHQSWKDLNNKGSSGVTSLVNAVTEYTNAFNHVTNTEFSVVVKKDNVVMEVGKASSDLITVPNRLKTSDSWIADSTTEIKLKKNICSGLTGYSSTFYRNISSLFPKYLLLNGELQQFNGSYDVNSIIADFMIHGTSCSDYSLIIKFEHLSGNYSRPFCGFWDFGATNTMNGAWSFFGSRVVESTDSYTICEYNHTTNFAVLMSPGRTPRSHHFPLSLISAIGCGVSIVCLLITILIYSVLWRHVKNLRNDRSKILMNLCVALILSYTIFLAGITRTEDKGVCTAFAVTLHYMFLTDFALMLAEGIQILRMVAFVFDKRPIAHRLLPACWVVPGGIVGISAIVTKLKGYGNQQFCWLTNESDLIWAFIGPALLVIVINFVIFIVMLYKLRTTGKFEKKTLAEKFKVGFRDICILFPLFGVTWVLGAFSLNDDLVVFQYLFAIFNSLQVRKGYKHYQTRRLAKRMVLKPYSDSTNCDNKKRSQRINGDIRAQRKRGRYYDHTSQGNSAESNLGYFDSRYTNSAYS